MSIVVRAACPVMLVAALGLLPAGCNRGETKKTAPDKAKAHAHPEVGPHKGVLVHWGEEEYHPELVFDRKKKEVVVYILDKDAIKAVPIKTDTLTLTLS